MMFATHRNQATIDRDQLLFHGEHNTCTKDRWTLFILRGCEKYSFARKVCAGDVRDCDKRTEHADKELGQCTNAR